MKKAILKGIVFGIVFFISLLVISRIMNQGNTDMTVEMEPASFPLIYMNYSGHELNALHGYVDPMEGEYLRDTVTPLEEGRGISLKIEKNGRAIKKISYEVRSFSEKRLVENTELKDYTESQDVITADFSIKDLIEDKTEYSLVVLLELDDGSVLRYYTRIIQAADVNLKEKLEFVLDFHERTFDKEEAKEITKYLESNHEGDNTTFHKVTIHSNFNQITWGDLQIKERMDEVVTLKDIDTQTGNFNITYRVKIMNGKDVLNYNVVESYNVRYTQDRMYLLDFERNMNQLFDENNEVFINNKIMLGVTNPKMELMESDGGNICAFVNENKLFSYNVTDNKFTVVYSFYDNNNMDVRTMYAAHNIKILNVDETGNIHFMVYGYNNRGRHEGRVGVSLNYYSSVTNTVEESAFLPYLKSYEILEADIEKLSYINKTGQFFLMLDNAVYRIDTENYSYDIIVNNLREESYKISDSNMMLAWQESGTPYESRKLIFMNLNTKQKKEIEVTENEYVIPLGFMGEDLIYGVARKSDVMKDSSGRVFFPMYKVEIFNEGQGILKTYQQDGIYMTDCSITSNQITLKRVQKTEDQYLATDDEHIMINEAERKGTNYLETVTTENFEKINQIALKSSINVKNLKILTPKEVLFEGGREIILVDKDDFIDRYYVYDKYGISDIYTDAGNAVIMAEKISGMVLNEEGKYVWKKGNRSSKNQIMKIQEKEVNPDKTSLAVCLDTILEYEGVNRNTEFYLSSGETAMSILNKNLPDAQVLDLSGCNLNTVLYYVNRDIPVLALLPDGEAVLIIGFNELNTVLFDPSTGKIYKKGMNDSIKLFEESGNSFITYLR